MKNFLCATILLFLFISAPIYGQIYKLKTTSYAVNVYVEDKSEWYGWTEWKDASILIIVDVNTERIKIFSNEEQVYDIILNLDEYLDKDNDNWTTFRCVDREGLKCTLKIVTLNSQGGQKQLYIEYSDVSWVYNLYLIE